MRRLRLWLVALAVLVAWTPASAGVNQVATGYIGANTLTVTFGAAPAANECVIIATSVGSLTATAIVKKTSGGAALTRIAGPFTHNSTTIRNEFFLYQGDGSDADFTVISDNGGSQGGSAVWAVAIAATGADCSASAVDASNFTIDSGTATHSVSVTTTADDCILFAMIRSSSAADFTAMAPTVGVGTGGTPDNTDFGTTVNGLGGYVATSGHGTFSIDFTSAATETDVLSVVAIKPASTGSTTTPRGLLLGVLP